MTIAVVALGKIGLPLAVQFADSGHEVGVNVNETVVDLVNKGIEPFPGDAHLQEKLTVLVPAGGLRATTDYAQADHGAGPSDTACGGGGTPVSDLQGSGDAVTGLKGWASSCSARPGLRLATDRPRIG